MDHVPSDAQSRCVPAFDSKRFLKLLASVPLNTDCMMKVFNMCEQEFFGTVEHLREQGNEVTFAGYSPEQQLSFFCQLEQTLFGMTDAEADIVKRCIFSNIQLALNERQRLLCECVALRKEVETLKAPKPNKRKPSDRPGP